MNNYYEAKFLNGKISDLSSTPSKPGYSHVSKELSRKVSLLKEETEKAINDGRDLLSTIQAEFSMYAVWVAVIALISSASIGVVAMVGG